MRRLVWWLGCAVALALASGCGSTTTATTTSLAPTKAQYIERADAICSAHEQEVRKAIVESYKSPASSAQAAIHKEYAASQRADAQLGSIPMPAGSTQVLLEWLHWRKLATADSATAAKLSAATTATTEANRLARAYGLKVCGHSGV